MHRVVCLSLVVAVATQGACGDPELTCVTVDLACAPLYAPTYENVTEFTIHPKCAAAGCHTAAASRGGLVLDDSVNARDVLVNRGYLVPGDVACSELTERIFTDESSLRMPRGSPLPAGEACAVAQWVAAGAPGPTRRSAP
jgi:hypothetical protein